MRLIETHVSFIFITDHFVYKVKKPVDFGFLNFSTIDRRRFYCEEEVRLNRRLCREIYLGVVELRETPEGAAFKPGPGMVLDYAVKMKRLPEERMLAGMLERDEVSREQMAELARYLADFHAKAARGPEIDACGSVNAIRGNWTENFRQVATFHGQTLAAHDLALIRNYVDRFLAENEELLRARVRGGFIRECDGDLHLGNICLADSICVFDCIEFNERFRYTDTAADIAFLLMDLEYCGRADLCPPFLEAYQEATADRGMAALLNFYQSYRAFIRGKVLTLRLQEQSIAAAEFDRAKSSAERYFRLSRGYALRELLTPSLIVTCGLMGSGKSALARELGFQLGLEVLRSDAVRKALPVSSRQAKPDGYDQGIYSASFNQATYDVLLKSAAEALSQGRSIIVDATFRRRGERERFRRLAGELGASFVVLETRCPETLIKQRLESRSQDPHELSDGRWELFPKQRAEFEALAEGEGIPIDSTLPLAQEADQALKALGILS